ncbi:malate dehydrogenase [Pseudomonas sp. SWI6]|uniref:Malate dehydrogenase n=1 Tax=Pseudomonas taiwanensis TaxID=470150 RepID=A0ABR6V3Y5_9PSED|nr:MULTISPECIES: malate dehydrogenase [Pseudomonas]MBC3475219.1 malate dehydrogenase [Pseudomonas taiwanensis]AGZ34937.1 malate dehydrogenase [Pseudomonas sp. VLB120]AVD83568.1 malate dehydrogenase [Pseudomonas sp. SWI6]AVD85715.1 malate dehydrogenase [Pseudomonas sp. SWI44]MBC3490169.1 malate dehydrogenase [Pseudomonas taiwanensis]
MNKLSIVGAGMVGEAAAQAIAREELCSELVLIDVQGDLARGKALDVWQAAVESGSDTRVYGGADAQCLQGSDLVVITAGVPRKPGQSRQDVLSVNLPILDGIMRDIQQHAPAATVLVVSNPVDVLTYRAWSLSGLGRNKVFGQAGVLDTARMKCFIAEETGFSARDITALVLGGHGDSMVPLMRYCAVGSVPLSHFLSDEQIARIVQRTRQGGGEILGLKKSGSACDAPGVAIARMVDAIAYGRRSIVPTVAMLEGEYGRTGIAMGVPCVLAADGISQVIELPLDTREQAMFDHSADQVARDIAEMNALVSGTA